MHGIGNDFVLVKASDLPNESAWPQLAQAMCDRKFGIGSDGLLIAAPSDIAPLAMRMLNPDGSESEMCGNGIRCFAQYAREEGLAEQNPLPVETGAGVLHLDVLEGGQVRVDMGPARLTRGEIGMGGEASDDFVDQMVDGLPATAVSMGNPHLVLFVDDIAAVDAADRGPILELHELFPNRVNVHYVQVVNERHLIQKTWERGAGVTLACGTGACACGVAAAMTGRASRDVQIDLPGGRLQIEWAENGHVFMTGPATLVFRGKFHD
ncbi:MAG: diaminopimelate epimerase [Fimbriimonadaceae bacterium]|nr:diaminopimelate epimerase [Fimbriimonadaceae bacterium]